MRPAEESKVLPRKVNRSTLERLIKGDVMLVGEVEETVEINDPFRAGIILFHDIQIGIILFHDIFDKALTCDFHPPPSRSKNVGDIRLCFLRIPSFISFC